MWTDLEKKEMEEAITRMDNDQDAMKFDSVQEFINALK